ncbi:uncharacterized protein LY79DRAFT_673634 [Colletotrichum navitas]|uniref:Uncharacterized protein n=1 Tax=Colletotrichum navitas TaxID=681940 RepID=A0AAD8UZA5_9PEZI|nr:uncharacterized protein LY79DRAFT_673634 [Colletotrichum navitas]KAK1573447.1 hypothetical protein LY79DRAFT_673634 [Colletotrichum navitas]
MKLQFDLVDYGTTINRNRTNDLPPNSFESIKTTVWAYLETVASPRAWGRAVPVAEGQWDNYIESPGSAMFYLKTVLSGYELMTDAFASTRKSDNALVWGWTVQTSSLISNEAFEASHNRNIRKVS